MFEPVPLFSYSKIDITFQSQFDYVQFTDCVEIFDACSSKFVSNLLSGHHCTYRVAITNWLAKCDNVWIDI